MGVFRSGQAKKDIGQGVLILRRKREGGNVIGTKKRRKCFLWNFMSFWVIVFEDNEERGRGGVEKEEELRV